MPSRLQSIAAPASARSRGSCLPRRRPEHKWARLQGAPSCRRHSHARYIGSAGIRMALLQKILEELSAPETTVRLHGIDQDLKLNPPVVTERNDMSKEA